MATRVRRQIIVRAPIDYVFERVSDHEDMANWPGVKACRLVREGEPRNGVGAVRQLESNGLTLQEEVVRFDPPHGYDYRIIKGLPVRHYGSVELRETGDGVSITWEVRMSSRIPLLARVIGMALDRGLNAALAKLARRIEESVPKQAA